jgi:hypothetical protein
VRTCTVCNASSPDAAENCLRCDADLSIHSQTAKALVDFQNNERVYEVRLIVAHDCCPACREGEGAYPKDDVPKLPVNGCSHALGCRCYYEPALVDIYP